MLIDMKKCNVSYIKDCYGCGVCAMTCPKHLIDMHLNKKGFYEPFIEDATACTYCGLCLKFCSFISKEIAVTNVVQDWWAMWSRDADVIQTCSSGGVAFELAKTALSQNYKIVAVRYNVKKQRAEHCVCSTIEELNSTKGSKYVQSYASSTLQSLDLSQKYLVVGSPCQIDSIRRFIRQRKVEQNFILIDFFCHGIPSYNVWKKFVKRYSNRISGTNDVAFRCKNNYAANEAWPWHKSFVVTFKKYHIRESFQPVFDGEKDWFYHYFLDDLCLGEQCYFHCKYKMYSSSADIRIGDAWTSLYEKNEKGVSAVLAFTKEGMRLIQSTNNLVVEKPDIEQLLSGQMISSPKYPKYYKLRLVLMRSSLTFEQIDELMNKIGKIKHIKHRINGYFRRLINHA